MVLTFYVLSFRYQSDIQVKNLAGIDWIYGSAAERVVRTKDIGLETSICIDSRYLWARFRVCGGRKKRLYTETWASTSHLF